MTCRCKLQGSRPGSSRPPSVASKVSPRPGSSISRQNTNLSKDSFYSSSVNIDLGSAETRTAGYSGADTYHPFDPDASSSCAESFTQYRRPPTSGAPSTTKRRIRRSRSKAGKTLSNGWMPEATSGESVSRPGTGLIRDEAVDQQPITNDATTHVPSIRSVSRQASIIASEKEKAKLERRLSRQNSQTNGNEEPREESRNISRRTSLSRQGSKRINRRGASLAPPKLSSTKITDLDDNTLIAIITYLDERDMVSMQLVSVRMRELCQRAVNDRLKRAIVKQMEASKPVKQRRRSSVRKQSLSVSRRGSVMSRRDSVEAVDDGIGDEDVQYVLQEVLDGILQSAATITELDLSNQSLHSSQVQLLASAKMKQVQRLMLAGCFEHDSEPDHKLGKLLSSVKKNLEYLDISLNSTIKGKCFSHLKPRLQHLFINNCIGIKDVHVETLASNCDELVTLAANGIRCDLQAVLMANARTMQHLELDYYEESIPHYVIGDMAQLTHFQMSNTYALTQPLIDALTDNCHQLRVLRIGGKEAAIGKIKLIACKNFTELQILDIGFWSHLPDSEYCQLIKHGQLVDVNVHGCSRLTQPALIRTIRQNIGLRQLCVTECDKIDSSFVKDFLQYAADAAKSQMDRLTPLTLMIGSSNSRDPSVDGFNNHNFVVDKVRQWRFD